MREGAAAEVLTPCLAPLAFALESGDGGARGRAVPGVLYRGTCPCGVLGLPGGLPVAGRDVSPARSPEPQGVPLRAPSWCGRRSGAQRHLVLWGVVSGPAPHSLSFGDVQ